MNISIEKAGKVLDYIIVLCLSMVMAFSLFNIRLLKICFVISVLSWILKKVLQKKQFFYKYLIPQTFLNKSLGIFIAACFLSVIFGIDFKYSQRVFFERYIPFIVFFFLGVGLAKENPKYIKFLLLSFLVSGFFMSIGGIWDYFTLNLGRLHTSFGNRFFSLHYYFTLLCPLSVILFLFSKDKFLKILSGLTALVSVPCLIWNFYRGAIVAFIISVIIVSCLKNKKAFICIILIILIGLFFFLPDRYINRMGKTLNTNTWGDRIPMWKSAVSIWKDYPVFGAGIRKYKDLMFLYEPEENSISRNLQHAHNTYFQILAEEGIIGLLAFLFIFYVFFKNVWIKRKQIIYFDECAVTSGVIAVIIASLIFSISHVLFVLLPSHTSILWILFGIGVGKLTYEDKQKQIF